MHLQSATVIAIKECQIIFFIKQLYCPVDMHSIACICSCVNGGSFMMRNSLKNKRKMRSEKRKKNYTLSSNNNNDNESIIIIIKYLSDLTSGLRVLKKE